MGTVRSSAAGDTYCFGYEFQIWGGAIKKKKGEKNHHPTMRRMGMSTGCLKTAVFGVLINVTQQRQGHPCLMDEVQPG